MRVAYERCYCVCGFRAQSLDYSLFMFLGTGKTATFSISILQQIDTNLRECQALILAPTRELAQQVSILKFWLYIRYRFCSKIVQN